MADTPSRKTRSRGRPDDTPVLESVRKQKSTSASPIRTPKVKRSARETSVAAIPVISVEEPAKAPRRSKSKSPEKREASPKRAKSPSKSRNKSPSKKKVKAKSSKKEKEVEPEPDNEEEEATEKQIDEEEEKPKAKVAKKYSETLQSPILKKRKQSSNLLSVKTGRRESLHELAKDEGFYTACTYGFVISLFVGIFGLLFYAYSNLPKDLVGPSP